MIAVSRPRIFARSTTLPNCRPRSKDPELKRMKAVVARASQQVKLFQSRMNDRGLAPEDIRSLDDIAKLPFTVKSDLRDTYPFGLFASPMKDVVRLHVS